MHVYVLWVILIGPNMPDFYFAGQIPEIYPFLLTLHKMIFKS